MAANRHRLDRFLSRALCINRRDVRPLLAQGRVTVGGRVAKDIHQSINQFSTVLFDGKVLQDNVAHYVMLNKPDGVVSATKDAEHPTVMDLLAPVEGIPLHIAGRLDRHSTGLMLLTNDGEWSRGLSLPENQVEKVYRVEVAQPITQDYVTAFAAGMVFDYEGITTRPVTLTILGERIAELTLVEGRYHQIKRMFGRFRNPVLSIHRVSIGAVCLDAALPPGGSRPLTANEVARLSFQSSSYKQ